VNFQDLISVVQEYIEPSMLIVVVALWVVGFAIKQTPKIADWLIIWVLTIIGVVAGIVIVGANIDGVIQGVLASGIANYAHQLFKQTKERK